MHISNAFGVNPLPVLGAGIAIPAGGCAIQPGSYRPLTFGGKPRTEIPAGALAISDPLDGLSVRARESLTVDLMIGWDGASPTVNHHALQTTFLLKGDHLGRRTLYPAGQALQRLFLSGVDVQADTPATLVAFGDSITAGQQSSQDANHRYPDLLHERMLTHPTLAHVAMTNRGISGNRLLRDRGGPSGVSRFARDVLGTTGVRAAIVLIGLNDIILPEAGDMFGPHVTADEMIAGYTVLLDAARIAGVRMIGGTILPFGANARWTEAGEATRLAINDWIRDSGAWDAVIDFDAAVRDPDDPRRMCEAFTAPGGLHPRDDGYIAMAGAADFAILAHVLGD